MDEQVLGAMQKWPNVPAVYGWLSLNAQGDWLLHTQGGAREGQSGEKIANEQIRHFMNRNYAVNEAGEWFFQNGPQRVFVDLACAPYIVRLADDMQTLLTHNELPVTRISQWLLDAEGRLYMQTEHGAAMLAGRDMGQLSTRLQVMPATTGTPAAATPLDQSHLQTLQDGGILQVSLDGASDWTAPMQWLENALIPGRLGFVREPAAS
ncbi:MAG TPA: DUF2946 family protein [Advenella sp.]|nr:DUF2946 family protein [Advenella sp.]